ncbi:MAG: SpoIIE family protein phosphatase [Proteobacteria bacterium]|nr:SpoIIE family protein phosphatase [Pseudomonadota bacterium]
MENINLAGRQRMLSQKVTKELLLYLGGDAMAYQQALKTARLFDKVHKDLLAFEMSEKDSVRRAGGHVMVLSQMMSVDNIWGDFSQELFDSTSIQTANSDYVDSILVLSNELLEEMDKAVSIYEDVGKAEFDKLRLLQFLCLFLAALTAVAAFSYLVRQIIRPLDELQAVTDKMSDGDLSQRAEVVSGNIVGKLAKSFNLMAESLNGFYVDLEKKVAERTEALVLQKLELEEKNSLIEADLLAAKQVQSSLLPETLPSIPFIKISAKYIPIDNIGGDYYDVVKIDSQYGFLIADVVGHGVKAAFLTTLIKIAFNLAAASKDTAETLRSMSSFLVKNISSDSFVTAFYGLYDPVTGALVYSSAGHPAPIMYKASKGKFFPLKTAAGMPLGFVECPDYKIVETKLELGDKLFLYTDGIEEALDESGDLMSSKRVLSFVESQSNTLSGESLAGLMVDSGTGGMLEGFDVRDDITLVVIEKVPSELMIKSFVTRELNPSIECEEIYSFLMEAGFAEEGELLRVVLCLDEAFSNAIIHGNLEYPSNIERDEEWEMGKVEKLLNHEFGDRSISFSLSLELDKITITVGDEGPGFDYRRLTSPTADENIMKTGGRGIAIIRQFMDEVTFNDAGNEISMSVSKASLKAQAGLALPFSAEAKDKRVLIIDDNSANIIILKKVLTAEGYNVAESTDPFYGLLLVGEFNPDIVILDLQMPEVSGSDISKRLKSNSATKHIKILVVSAHLPSSLDELHAIRADDYLSKPVAINTLIERVSQMTGVRQKS